MNEAQSSTSKVPPHAVSPGLIHDLRTPLNQIIGYSEMIVEQRRDLGPDEITTDVQSIHGAGQRLLALIEENFCATTAPEVVTTTSLSSGPASPDLVVPSTGIPDEKPGSKALLPLVEQGFLLVVDDIEANRDVLARRLERQGYTVDTVENGRQAIQRLRAETFDLVLLDIMMPEMDGYEVLRQLKADDVLRHIPVIMISALDELDSVVRCIEMGAEDYLSKPFNPILLRARIGACLEKKRLRDREIHLFRQLQTHNAEMARWREMLDADLAAARVTQQAIVSAPLPSIHGWHIETVYTPVIQVGGDVYGWRQLDQRTWLIWLADATGHGVAAALFTTLVAFLFDRASSASNTAHGILSRVNAEFYDAFQGRSFISACCVVIDSDGGLSTAGAGHPPLFILRRDGTVETLPSGNMLIGIDPGAITTETSTNLAPGDSALLYTDGLHSLRTRDGARMTHRTVADALATIDVGADLLPRLITQLIERSDAQLFEDDLAAISLQFGPKAEK